MTDSSYRKYPTHTDAETETAPLSRWNRWQERIANIEERLTILKNDPKLREPAKREIESMRQELGFLFKTEGTRIGITPEIHEENKRRCDQIIAILAN